MIPQHSSKSSEWYTPKPIVELARQVMGSIDTDPFSSLKAQEIVRAKTYYTYEQDGLKQELLGNVFCNPPGGYITYVDALGRWEPSIKWDEKSQSYVPSNSGESSFRVCTDHVLHQYSLGNADSIFLVIFSANSLPFLEIQPDRLLVFNHKAHQKEPDYFTKQGRVKYLDSDLVPMKSPPSVSLVAFWSVYLERLNQFDLAAKRYGQVFSK